MTEDIEHNSDDGSEMDDKAKYTWEEAVRILRDADEHRALIYNSYLTSDLVDNCRRFHASSEFEETLRILNKHISPGSNVLDIPAGNGIATYAFVKEGFAVTSVEPDPSDTVGRGAIEFVLNAENMHDNVTIINGYGENIPLANETFDAVYVRQGLHHARDLQKMVNEINRVLKKGGVLIASREHVVNNYNGSLKAFLDSQPDHQLYGGEFAYTHRDYKKALAIGGFTIIGDMGPYDSIINMFPSSLEDFRHRILASVIGKALARVLPTNMVCNMGIWCLKKLKRPGRLHTFVALKQGD